MPVTKATRSSSRQGEDGVWLAWASQFLEAVDAGLGSTEQVGASLRPSLSNKVAFPPRLFNFRTADKTLFRDVAGGIRFDRNDVANTLAEVKGYTLYFTNYLATLPTAERDLITQQLPEQRDWFIQAGRGGMRAEADTQCLHARWWPDGCPHRQCHG
jgi:hypothetical protein